jgi:class 3 adenylate cyclase/tetratricopeptide (TPR) repeat protein
MRKTVTVIFCDVTGSTALGERLDPESLRHLMGRYFEEMRTVIERHGGLVEKFIGDAVMAAFGVPVLHEDDALRAVRAASEMRQALVALNQEFQRVRGVSIDTRIGVNTGEVLVGDPSPERGRVTGDAVNTAARLEQAAEPGEILIGQETYRLVREAVEAEPGESLSLKGKSELVPTFRLLDVRPVTDSPSRRLEAQLVGRERPAAMLVQSFEAAVADNACHLFTVLGAAGVGKSRLVEEFIGTLGEGSMILRGRCLPYGEGITFWPIVEAVRELASISDGDLPSEARGKIAALVDDEEHADRITDGVGTALGLAGLVTAPDELLWSIRKLFESIARRGPLVIAFDDIHWGEPTFLDLVEHIANWSRDAPILLLCIAREDLLDKRATWGGGTLNATTIHLEPLSIDESEQLVDLVLGRAELAGEARKRIAEAADGNPLFVEEMISMLIDEGTLFLDGGRWRAARDLSSVPVPPSIQALLASRLDQLGAEERAVAERASIEGRVFHRAAVMATGVGNGADAVDRPLAALMRRELIRPDRSSFVGDEAFRFRHVLIRDAAYHSIPKDMRANLHERFASWLEEAVGNRIQEYEEILAYHLEQAYRYRKELGPVGDADRALAARAAEFLASSAQRAIARIDLPAAASMLTRAVDLVPEDGRRRVELLTDLGATLNRIGDYGPAEKTLIEAVDRGTAVGDDHLRARARLDLLWTRTTTGGASVLVQMPPEIEEILPILERHGDDLGLTKAWQLLAQSDEVACRYDSMREPLERALVYARRAEDRLEEAEVMWGLMYACVWGSEPVPKGIRRCDEILRQVKGDRRVEASVKDNRALLEAMLGNFQEARETHLRSRETLQDLGVLYYAYNAAWGLGSVEMLAGDPVAAERAFRTGFDTAQRPGNAYLWDPLTAYLAQAVCAQGRFDEVLAIVADASKDTGESVRAGLFLRSAKAKALAGIGDLDQAQELVGKAIVLAAETESIDLQGDIQMDAAEVLIVAGRTGEARAALENASSLYERKGNVVSGDRARATLEGLGVGNG